MPPTNSPDRIPTAPQVTIPTNTMKQHRSGKGLKMTLIVLLVLIIGLAGGGFGYRWYNTKYGSSSKPAVVTTTTALPTTEQIKEDFSLQSTKSDGTDLPVPVTISLTAPTALRTQISLPAGCLVGEQLGFSANTQLKKCLNLISADKLGDGTSLVSTNELNVWDLTDWLKVNEDGTAFSPFGLTKATDKQAAWAAMQSITATTNLKTIFAKLPNLATDAAYVDGPQKLTYVQSADGNLKGVAFITTVGQSEGYDPSVLFELSGTIGGESAFLTGSMRASDPTANKIAQLEADDSSANQDAALKLITPAETSLKAGKVSAQTQEAFDQVLTLLKSIKIATR